MNREVAMLSIELQFVSNGRRLSLNDVVDLVAEKLASRLTVYLKERPVQPTQATHHNAPRAVSVQEAARLLSVSEAALRKFIGRKRLRAIHVGARVLIPMEVIDTALRDGIPTRSTTDRD
jgi:excisionase family DNA binding protein